VSYPTFRVVRVFLGMLLKELFTTLGFNWRKAFQRKL
jgi:hypothetical protein